MWDHATCKLIVSRDVSFNEPRSSKEGEKAQTPYTDKGKSPLDVVEGEIDHDSFHDDSQGGAPRVELVLELQEQQELVIVGEPHHMPAQIDQPESSTRRTSSRTRNAPERFGQWVDTTQLGDYDLSPQDDDRALILEEGEPSSYYEARASMEKLEWDAAM